MKDYIVKYEAYMTMPNKRYISGCRIIKAESEEEALEKFKNNVMPFKVPTSYCITKTEVKLATNKDLRKK